MYKYWEQLDLSTNFMRSLYFFKDGKRLLNYLLFMNSRVVLYGFLIVREEYEVICNISLGKQLLFCFAIKKESFRYTKNIIGGELQWIL